MKESKSSSQASYSLTASPLFVVLSGPSGVGKDAVLARMKASRYSLEYITTVTTRPRRAKEKDSVDYNFISVKKFEEMVVNGELLEWAKVYNNYYGVPRQPVKAALKEGRDAIVKVDVQGAATIRKLMPQAVFIFLLPPSGEELAARLKQRRTEQSFALALRIETAEEEIKQLPLFDYVVVNRQGEIDLAVSKIAAIIVAEGCRVTPREITL
jgi:guanylate kinase